MWVWHFQASSLVCSNQQRLCKIFFIDVVSMFLLAFSASMKAEVLSYQKHVSVFGVYTCIFKVSKVSTLVSVFTSLRLRLIALSCKHRLKERVCVRESVCVRERDKEIENVSVRWGSMKGRERENLSYV